MEKKDRGNYYEAILQIRNSNEEVANCVSNAINKQKDLFIAKEVRYKDGFDLYLSSQKFAHQLGKLLKKSFKGKVVVSEAVVYIPRRNLAS